MKLAILQKILSKHKVFYGQETPEENLLPLFVGLIIIINYYSSVATEVALLSTTS